MLHQLTLDTLFTVTLTVKSPTKNTYKKCQTKCCLKTYKRNGFGWGFPLKLIKGMVLGEGFLHSGL